MESRYRSCTIHTSASIENGSIVGNARIYLPTVNDGDEVESHDMEFHLSFVDENEAIAFAKEGAIAWIDEHEALSL
ncbi:hypothetical protein [Caballeronia concitans]|jgi:hypothetical protein|uniref:Uncharacterized protein n=1 Tax=Caballeronia concitans TaxID=1777133 RepID=A0A658QUG8_9BURK|nr:hypothetical protein [Caballeronia concitans]KIG07524.1 hypothetical protein BurMR1_0354 [Burkholderia sp. MR1]SAL22952.1 hypothetical protein AWB72_01648 [Caballeronia concitans]